MIVRLTPRQRQIVRALLAGATNRQIAKRLGLKEQTVRNQLSLIYSEVGVHSRLELALYATSHGLETRSGDD